MIVDKNLQFSAVQILPNNTTALSTYSVDMSASGKDYFKGKTVYAIVTVDVAPTGTTNLTIEAVTSTAASGTTGELKVCSTGAIPLAQLTLGKVIVLPLGVSSGANIQRYLMLKYTTDAAETVGYVSAFLSAEPGQTNLT